MMFEENLEQPIEEENYFISMTDMMVGLVFIFIILLMYFALQVQDVTEGANRTRDEILEKIQESLRDRGVEVEVENGVLRLPNAILFDSAEDKLKPSGLVAAGHLATALSEVLPCYADNKENSPRSKTCPETDHRVESVYIEGHTDSDPYTGGGLIRDNWDLSVVRATNTYRALRDARPQLESLCVRRDKICQSILSVSGYGDRRPVPDPSGEIDPKKNDRRIALRLIMVTPYSSETVGVVGKGLADR